MNANITNGQGSLDIIKDTAVHTNLRVSVMKALGGDVVFASVEGGLKTAGALDGETLSNGDILTGCFTKIQLSSGHLAIWD